jgi:predicted nucleic acid-binding protein
MIKMALVQIDTNAMRNSANQINSWREEMISLLNSINDTAHRLVTVFNMRGAAITNFLTKINAQIRIVIDRACAEILNFVNFLLQAADAFDAAEAQGVAKVDGMATVF